MEPGQGKVAGRNWAREIVDTHARHTVGGRGKRRPDDGRAFRIRQAPVRGRWLRRPPGFRLGTEITIIWVTPSAGLGALNGRGDLPATEQDGPAGWGRVEARYSPRWGGRGGWPCRCSQVVPLNRGGLDGFPGIDRGGPPGGGNVPGLGFFGAWTYRISATGLPGPLFLVVCPAGCHTAGAGCRWDWAGGWAGAGGLGAG